MASSDIIDFDRLLAPISEDEPAGLELKEDPELSAIYYQVKDARESARTAEKQLAELELIADVEEEDPNAPTIARPNSPDWSAVVELGTDVIAEKSKDLWVTAWIIEALGREHGFAGLRDGFRLARELCERFWDGIHPRPDEDGYATTVAQLAGLNGQDSDGVLLGPINEIPITQYESLTSRDHIEADNLDQSVDSGKLARFEKAVNETPPEFFSSLLADIDQSIEEFERLNKVLEEQCGKDTDGYSVAPASSSIHTALQTCRDRVHSISRHLLEVKGEAEDESGDMLTISENGSVQTREQAFRALLRVADYFRTSEPHSPVSYALEQAVRWGRMSLPDLLNELIRDESAREELFRRTGISPNKSSESD